jgi:hypothetical protein
MSSAGSHTIAVMQPYFYPYPGYFRLLDQADHVVLFDDVQFPRRGRVHRCQVPGPGGAEEWLTLPIAHHARDTLIKDIGFAPEARTLLDARLARLPWLGSGQGALAPRVRQQLRAPLVSLIDFLEDGLRLVADALGLRARISRSSDLALDASLRGEQRIIRIARHYGASEYLNLPGGRELYDPSSFREAGLGLRFLEPYGGPYRHMLPALLNHDAATLLADIRAG